jgi:hypothetical protein
MLHRHVLFVCIFAVAASVFLPTTAHSLFLPTNRAGDSRDVRASWRSATPESYQIYKKPPSIRSFSQERPPGTSPWRTGCGHSRRCLRSRAAPWPRRPLRTSREGAIFTIFPSASSFKRCWLSTVPSGFQNSRCFLASHVGEDGGSTCGTQSSSRGTCIDASMAVHHSPRKFRVQQAPHTAKHDALPPCFTSWSSLASHPSSPSNLA